MLVALQLETVALVPLNLTVLLPCVLPKFDPATVTDDPTAPDVGDKLLMLGVPSTVKLFPLLAFPDTVTTTFPVVAPVGTVTTMLVALQLVTVAVLPLNFTVLLPCVVPKPDPAIVTEAPTAPDVGVKLVIEGAAATLRTLKRNKAAMNRTVLKIPGVRGDMNESSEVRNERLGVRRGCAARGSMKLPLPTCKVRGLYVSFPHVSSAKWTC